MPVFWLPETDFEFPPAELASPEGLLAVGGNLSSHSLLQAYTQGIFPWFNPEDPILWWSPNPRFVLFPNELIVARSMRPYFNQQRFQVTYDRFFERVMRACAQTWRKGQGHATWISEEMIEAYTELHRQGYAHSVEVWQEEALVGGLYGIALGKVFFGESMFAHVSNASKFGFITLVKRLQESGCQIIDCQQQTGHLASLGARSIPRKEFQQLLSRYAADPGETGPWVSI